VTAAVTTRVEFFEIDRNCIDEDNPYMRFVPPDHPTEVLELTEHLSREGPDSAQCASCGARIAWYLDYDLDETGRETGGFITFTVVLTNLTCFAVCEDCAEPLLGPVHD
jgi:hypothetical protein